MRDALSLLDQCVAFHFGEKLTYDNVLEVLGAVDNRVFSKLFQAVLASDTKACIREIEEMIIQGRDLSQLVNDFVWYMRNLLIAKTTDEPGDMLDMSEENLAVLKEEAAGVDTETLMRYIRIFSELSGQLRYASQKRILVEIAFIKLTTPSMEQNLDSILQRITLLEQKMQKCRTIYRNWRPLHRQRGRRHPPKRLWWKRRLSRRRYPFRRHSTKI